VPNGRNPENWFVYSSRLDNTFFKTVPAVIHDERDWADFFELDAVGEVIKGNGR
jgi:hypothetical protein